MAKRRAISKKTRFEVFKRDSFACQYCGASAPDVLLVVDHIKPVCKGGDNDITNLITACAACNNGKGPRELADNSVIEKQKKQLQELNERRLQLEMMLEWREGLAELEDQKEVAICKAMAEHSDDFVPNEIGRRKIRKWLKRYSFDEILKSVDTSYMQYLMWDDEGKATRESYEKAFSYIPRIISVERWQREKPYLRDLYYIRGILRNRLNYVNEVACMRLLEQAHEAGATVENLREFAKSVHTWTAYRDGIYDFLEEHGESK